MAKGASIQEPDWHQVDDRLRKPIQDLFAGNGKAAVPQLVGVAAEVVGTCLGMPGLGTATTAASSVVAGLVVDSAIKRMQAQERRLDDEHEQRRALADLLTSELLGRLKHLWEERDWWWQVLEVELQWLHQTQLEHLVSMARTVVRQHEQTRDAVAKVGRQVAALDRTVRGELGDQEARVLLHRYRQFVIDEHSRLRGIFHSEGLERVFVELAVDERSSARERALEQVTSSAGGHQGQTLRDLMDPSLVQAGGAAPRWVVWGEPGAGKSTLARRLTRQLAKEHAHNETGPLPVYCPLPGLAMHRRAVFDWAQSELEGAHGKTKAHGLSGLLEGLARAGQGGLPRVWLLLDGLDEVPQSRLEWVQARLRNWADEFPGVPIVVLSRPIGYQPLGAPYDRLAQVQPLDRSRQRELLHNWLGDEASVKQVLSWIDASAGLRDACRVPLMLSLLAFLRDSSSEDAEGPPHNRLDLYERSLQELLRRGHAGLIEDEAGEMRGVQNAGFARAILQEMCYQLQQAPETEWTRQALEQTLLQVAKGDSGLRDRLATWRDATAFLDDVKDRSGVLAPYDGVQAPWRFLHRQFGELLAAQGLRSRGGDAAVLDQAKELTEAQMAQWAEVLAFACELAGDGALEVLKALSVINEDLALRVLPELERIDCVEALGLLREGKWDGDYLVQLLERWLAVGNLDVQAVIGWLWQQVAPERTTDELAYFYYALEHLAGTGRAKPVDGERFFKRCERWPQGGPPEPDYLELPGGAFEMGSDEAEAERQLNERPHTVTVSAFALSKAAVRNAEYERFDPMHERELFSGRLTEESSAHHPVVNVSWWEAYLYARWIGGDLPTEAQWEYACRAGTVTPFSFGETITPKQVNYDGNYPYVDGKKGEYRQATVAVRSLPPNGWGLHEMHGNVWEWCHDWYSDYDEDPTTDPSGPETGTGRVLRGGSWVSDAGGARSPRRFRLGPGSRDGGIGFRVSRGQAQARSPRSE
ncbi:MAG: SUMF1/EgtB/PvdO family nonheme iron enzyme [Myxococcales bacterium]|nr:SUMF1/EgtB/PvdO family nonheme iron enzyme [Myxococcales bacterium]